MVFSPSHGGGLHDQGQAKGDTTTVSSLHFFLLSLSGGKLLLEDNWGGTLFLLILPGKDLTDFLTNKTGRDWTKYHDDWQSL